MKLSKLQPVLKYIDEYVTHPKNNCFFYAAALKIQFPFLTLMKGPPQTKEETAHFFLIYNNHIIDPTISQYNFTPTYNPAKEISIEKNINSLTSHPLFPTLPNKTQSRAINIVNLMAP